MRVEARGERQEEYCASMASCAESCPEGYGTCKYDEHGNTNDYSCTILPCCDPAYECPCNDADYYDKVSKDYEQCGCPCSDPEYFTAICACLSGIVACVLDPIFRLLAALGIYTSPALNDEEQVKQFLAWAKEPSPEGSLITTATMAAHDSAQWKAQFEKLPLDARRYAMQGLSALIYDEAYVFIQKRLAGAQYEEGSDQMYLLIEQGMNDQVLYHSGSSTVIMKLELWLPKKPEVSLQTLFSPRDQVRGFLEVWNPNSESTIHDNQGKPGFTWKECFSALPEAAKNHARTMFLVARHSSAGNVPQLPGIPKDKTSAEGKAAYEAYLRAAAEVDEQICNSVKDGVVIRALNGFLNKRGVA